MLIYFAFKQRREGSDAGVRVCHGTRGWFQLRAAWRAPRARPFPLLALLLCVLCRKSPEDQDSHPVCGVAHKDRSVPTQANRFLFHLKSEGRSMWALGQGFQRMWSMQRHVHADPLCRTFQDREASPQGAWLQGDPDLPLRSRGPRLDPRGAPCPRSLSSTFFPNRPVWMEAQGSVPRRGAASRSSRKGPLPEDGVNRLSLKVTSSGSGSGGQRKLQSFFRAVNARRKMH